jgi:hypothetical protein
LSSGVQEFRSSGVQEFRSSGVQEFRSSGVQEFRSSGVQALGGEKQKFKPKSSPDKEEELVARRARRARRKSKGAPVEAEVVSDRAEDLVAQMNLVCRASTKS